MKDVTGNPLGDLSTINAIFILLGPACNMSCRHCSQTPIKNTYALKPSEDLSPDVINFIDRWLQTKEPNTRSRIYFWGGEPLLYWDTIRSYILQFEARGFKPSCYRLFSNGLLLNDDIAEFCNKHNVVFTMSYDAPDPLAVRNNIPSEENIKSFLKIKNRNVNSVFNALNYDLVKAFNFLEEKFPATLISIGVINLTSQIPQDIYNFKNNQIAESINNLADEILSGHDPYGNRFRFFEYYFLFRTSFSAADFYENPWPPCAPGGVSISVRFNGDVIICHNDYRKIGHITDPFSELQAKHLQFWKESMPENCFSCPFILMCRSVCPIALYTKDKKEYLNCDIVRQLFKAINRNRHRLTLPNSVKPYINLFDGIIR